MKKNIYIVLTFLLFSVAHSQVLPKKGKPLMLKDTLKKITTENIATVQEQDTAFVEKGTFKLYKKAVHASYYSDRLVGKRTASGKKFDNNKFTAAHKKFPFGTKLRVTNELTGKSVVVEVIDRGPFVKEREIDITKRAFKQIAGNAGGGGIIVKLEVLEP